MLVSLLGAGQSDDHSGDAGEGQGDAHGDGEAASHADAGAADGHMVGHDGGTAAAHGDGHDGGHGAAHAAHDAMGVGAGHHSGSDGLDSGVPTALLWLMSIQLWTYLLAFGGLTGLLLRTVAKVGEPVAGLSLALRSAGAANDKGKVCIVGRNPEALWFDGYEDRVLFDEAGLYDYSRVKSKKFSLEQATQAATACGSVERVVAQ